MEATKTYSIGETNSFSGSSAAYRQLKPGNFLTGLSSPSFAEGILPLLSGRKISNQKADGYEIRNCFAFESQVIQVSHRIKEGPGLSSRFISVNISASIYKSTSNAYWACCFKLKKSNKFDCTITPSGRMKHWLFSENHVKSSTLGEVAALTEFHLETTTSWNADGKKPIPGATQTPQFRPEIAAGN